ncbi:hypothetical protein BD779DRAFT_1666354 [Infundibulicybe gibba]|nr:hypothetical protein BD779DRAFT_1666354 [Infundibulicybe gibba]
MSRRPSPTPRRIVAIKRVNGEPLTRADIQFDVLHNIFYDTNRVFTNPYPSTNSSTPPERICFRDLYIKAIFHAPKATRALKDKIADSDKFAEDFAMLALLVNVGRINTTMSFFPEMKTTIRTYHPIPALQRTDGNLQDAPRIKHILKSSLLEGDKLAHLQPLKIFLLELYNSNQIPATSVMNLIFVLANYSAPVGQSYLSENLDFIDLFIRGDISSLTRARAFLWLCYHFLEAPSVQDDDDYDDDTTQSNPFADPTRGKTPSFVMLTEAEAKLENQDPQEEKLRAISLVAQRNQILNVQGTKEGNKSGKAPAADSVLGDDDRDDTPISLVEAKAKAKRGIGGTKPKPSGSAKRKKAAADKLRRERLKEQAKESTPMTGPGSDDDDTTLSHFSKLSKPPQNQYPQHDYRYLPPEDTHPPLPYRRILSPAADSPSGNPYPQRHSPYKKPSSTAGAYISKHSQLSHRPRTKPSSRSMLQHAWHVITTTDPLIDSDDEVGDEHARCDYIQRLEIITRLRGKEPTPEPEHHGNDLTINTHFPSRGRLQ